MQGLENIGKYLIIIGIVTIVIGIILFFSAKITWIGKLPGDIIIKKENFTFYFPIATCIIISIILSIIFWIIRR
ncbi:MAG TPA: DUF2905 domain-containing protein [Nitrospirae bacterium]|nr:DUF2905 domain-containing protein [Nitrospirota bacterium]